MARRLRGQELNPLFHQRTKTEDEGQLSAAIINQARSSGVLNLSGRALTSGNNLTHLDYAVVDSSTHTPN